MTEAKRARPAAGLPRLFGTAWQAESPASTSFPGPLVALRHDSGGQIRFPLQAVIDQLRYKRRLVAGDQAPHRTLEEMLKTNYDIYKVFFGERAPYVFEDPRFAAKN
jgi:hypothetical protein